MALIQLEVCNMRHTLAICEWFFIEVAQNMLRVTMQILDLPPQYCYACEASVTINCYSGADLPPHHCYAKI